MSRIRTIMAIFGTRPEIIKLAPIIRQLDLHPRRFKTVNISTGQHADLLLPFIKLFGVQVAEDLRVMQPGQPLNALYAQILAKVDTVLARTQPDLVLVQGDTTTAAAATLASFHRGVPVAHVEAGLRTADPHNPFPEEMNRRLISRMASYHFAATRGNLRNLRREGVERQRIYVTGNPVVDALQHIGAKAERSAELERVLTHTAGTRRITLTTHRRENFAVHLEDDLYALRTFIAHHADVSLIFPVHPNPIVRDQARAILADCDRIHLLAPLDYVDFIHLLSESWLIVSDSGGVQEEAPSLGKRLLIIRENTERPEVLGTGLAFLAPNALRLSQLLEETYAEPDDKQQPLRNPFGRGDAGQRITRIIHRLFNPKLVTPR